MSRIIGDRAPVAQLDRASASGAEGRAFESRRAYGGQTGRFEASRFAFLRRCALTVLLVVSAFLAYASSASAQYFGQNKVPGPPREWRQLESAHFELYFYPEERELAETAIRYAERAYARLEQIYGHQVSARIPIILYGSQSEFRETRAISGAIGEGTGGVTELLKRRVLVPATGSIAEFDHVLTHELTHAFQLDVIAGSGGRRTADPLQWTPPLWVMEGLSEYLSVPGVDTHTEVWLRDAALEGDMPTLAELSWIGDLRVYRFGQSIVAYVAEQFGDEMLGPWLRGMAHRRSVERGTSEVLGVTLEQLSSDWHEALRKRYLPEISRREGLKDRARQLTDHTRSLANFSVTPALSPNGSELLYFSDDTPYADLYLASAVDGTHKHRLIGGERRETFESLRYYRTTLEWSPDGERAALIALTGGHDRLLVYDVHKRETQHSYSFGFEEMLSPTWSPDGQRIAFVGLKDGRSALYSCLAASGDSLVRLTSGEWAVFQPAWSPDGSRIAFVTDRQFGSLSTRTGDSPWRIAILELATGAVSVLDGMPGKSLNPQWFPDGRHLLFVTDRTGIPNLFVRDLEDGEDFALTDALTGVAGITPTAAAASLSRDGRRVVFSVYERGGWDLYQLQDPLVVIAGKRPWSPAGPETIAVRADDGVVAESESGMTVAEGDSAQAGPSGIRLDSAEDAAGDPAAMLPSAPEIAAPRDSLAPAPDPWGVLGDSELRGGVIPGRGMDIARIPPPQEDRTRERIVLSQVYARTDSMPDTLHLVEKNYDPRLSIDYAQAGGLYASGYGAVAQTLLVFSDMLGDRSLFVGADVSGSFDEGDYYLGFMNQRRRPALLFSLYQYQTGYGYGTVPGYPDIYQKRLIRGAGFAAFYPLSRFRRIELSLDAIQEKRFDWMCEELSQEDFWRCGWKNDHVDETYVAPGAALIHDTALFGPTGPLSGRRMRLGAGFFFGERQAGSYDCDYRLYRNIRKRYAVAWRLVAAGEWGRDRQRIAFGGPYSMRGYQDHPLYGSQIAFSNLEFRFPFIDAFVLAWPLRIGIGGIRGNLFFDVGGAWDDIEDFRAVQSGRGAGSFRLDDLQASVGFGASLNVGFAVLRWDLARRTDLSDWVGKAKGEFSMGWEF